MKHSFNDEYMVQVNDSIFSLSTLYKLMICHTMILRLNNHKKDLRILPRKVLPRYKDKTYLRLRVDIC